MTHKKSSNGASPVAPTGLFNVRLHYPALDGLRGAAALAVFADHYLGMTLGWRIFLPGWVGVEAFFVLSGFLITTGLYEQLGSRSYFSAFYKKRAFRIFPLYYAVWAALLALRFSLGADGFHPRTYTWLIYLGNVLPPTSQGLQALFSIAEVRFHHLPHVLQTIEVNHFWTLCVEEQFYLLWPLVIFCLGSRRKIMFFSCLIVLAEVSLRLMLFKRFVHTEFIYHQTWLRLDAFMIGSFIALLVSEQITERTLIRGQQAVWIGAGLPIAIYTLRVSSHGLPQRDLGSPFITTIGFTLIALVAGALLTACLNPGPVILAVFGNAWLRFLGKISYGFYIFHEMPRRWFEAGAPWLEAHHLMKAAVLGWFFATCGLASLSFRYFESPFLKLKRRLRFEEKPD